MDLHDFYYDLPEELIAQDPLSDRSSSRLMVLDKETGEIEHKIFRDIVDYLKPGDCLVVNDTKVIPARLIGTKADTGATIEVLLLKRLEDRQDTWEVLVKPGKKAKVGAKISFGEGKLIGEIIDIVEEGNRLIQFTYDGIFEEILDELGQMPLPPYITHKLEDKNRYQTVYAKHEGSAAAPTAGLHFTTELLEKIKAMGVNIARVTLHVGLGTFRPVKVENILDHHMHSEFYVVTQEAADMINNTRKNGGRVIAVGTTSTRTLLLVNNDIKSIVELVDFISEKEDRIQQIADRQKEIYRESSSRKRSIKNEEQYREYQMWHVEVQEELDELKQQKRELKRQLQDRKSVV